MTESGALDSVKGGALMSRPGLVARFDTVAWDSNTGALEVWRYPTGIYSGKHEVVLSTHTWGLVKDDIDLLLFTRVIGNFFSLSVISKEYHLPSPWFGYRFS